MIPGGAEEKKTARVMWVPLLLEGGMSNKRRATWTTDWLIEISSSSSGREHERPAAAAARDDIFALDRFVFECAKS